MSFKIEPRLQADDCVILNQRLLAYSREAVWEAWTRPERLARWWGPKGFGNKFHEFDLRPGGYWRFTMHGPDGSAYPNESRFVELVEPERIVFDHLSGHVFRVTASLAGHQSGTLLSFQMRFADPADFERCRAFVPQKNEENFDKLEAELARQTAPAGHTKETQ